MHSVVTIVFLVILGKNYALVSDAEDALLPRLFHSDEFERCVLQPHGLYCLGEFNLSPVGHSPMYDNILKYNLENPDVFNRSRLYRGYCVSTRCPSKEKNASLRFERCVNERMQRHALSAQLAKLQYCTTQQQYTAKMQQPPDAAQKLFLRVICAILTLNFIGTIYDVTTEDGLGKVGLIAAWSVRRSWRRLTASYNDKDPRLNQLEPIQGMRVVFMLISIYAHTCVQNYQFYVSNPTYLEILFTRTDGIILANGTSIIQFFVMISSFLTAYSLLLYAEKQQLSLKMLPAIVLKRIIRILPVSLLVIGFAATYFPSWSSGAMTGILEYNSASCRQKFWSYVFFLNNAVEAHDHNCLMPTWFLPIDLHLSIVSFALTIIMSRWKHQAIRLYVALFVASAMLCGLVGYFMSYNTMIGDTKPEILRGLFAKSESFRGFYISTLGSSPACFAGLFMAHLHYNLQKMKHDWKQNTWLRFVALWSVPLMMTLIVVTASVMRQVTTPWLVALYVALDRPLLVCMLLVSSIGNINLDGIVQRFYGWRGWRVPARLSLSVMLVHWLVISLLTARSPAYTVSNLSVNVNFLATIFYSYLIAVPLTLLVEIPTQIFFSKVF